MRRHPTLAGCLGITLLLLLLIAGLIGGGGGGGGDQQAQNEVDRQKQQGQQAQRPQQQEQQGGQQERQQQQGGEQEQQQAAPHSIGEEVNVGDVSYTVTNAELVQQLNDPYGVEPPLTGNFVLVTFTFANKGNDPVTVSDIGLYLYDEQGREYETDSDAAFYLPQDKSLYLLDRVNPGLSREVQTVYSVPPDARGFELEVSSGFWQTETARIALGF